MDQQTQQQPSVHQIADPQHRLVAVRFLHPASWQAQSQMQWNFQNYCLPVRIFARTFDPQTGAMMEFFPTEAFYWIDPYMGFQKPGQENGGSVLMQPMSAADAMTRWVIPKYRGNAQNPRITAINSFPQLPQVLKIPPANNGQHEGVSVKLEYSENGRTIEEEFIGLKVAYQGIPSYGAAGTLLQYNWGFDRLFSFRAEKGQLDGLRDLFWSITRSVEVNPQWEQLYAQVIQQMQQQFNQYLQAGYDSINAATQMSRQISAQNDAWLQGQEQRRQSEWQSDQMRRQSEQQSWGAYTNSDAFGDMMMGRETYNDPYYEYGSQHSGYHNYVWTDSQGSYQYSDDANFNPNIGGTTNWTLMEKKQVGQ